MGGERKAGSGEGSGDPRRTRARNRLAWFFQKEGVFAKRTQTKKSYLFWYEIVG